MRLSASVLMVLVCGAIGSVANPVPDVFITPEYVGYWSKTKYIYNDDLTLRQCENTRTSINHYPTDGQYPYTTSVWNERYGFGAGPVFGWGGAPPSYDWKNCQCQIANI